jgi:CheY-like chemotaxis protein
MAGTSAMGPSKFAPASLEPALTVLVADDDDINRQVLRALLEQRGHTVVEAQDGVQALEVIAGARPDLVLMDVDMPHLDGLAAARRVRTMSGIDRAVPIYALTGKASADDIAHVAACGMNGHLPKPVDLEALAHVLRHAVTRRAGAR